jgi:hypothetical protein
MGSSSRAPGPAQHELIETHTRLLPAQRNGGLDFRHHAQRNKPDNGAGNSASGVQVCFCKHSAEAPPIHLGMVLDRVTHTSIDIGAT